MQKTVRILDAEDHYVVREGVRLIISGEPNSEARLNVANGSSAAANAAIGTPQHRSDNPVLQSR